MAIEQHGRHSLLFNLFEFGIGSVQISDYLKALNSFDEAKTLHFLVTCFRSLDFNNSCHWNWEDDENPSKAWFKKLHKKYKGSYWAKKTPYHY
jgi:hypothetical protein